MYKKTNTKRALFFSALCMVLCVTMLVGSTFAWFTDNASVNVNKIESGNLKIKLVNEAGTDLRTEPLSFKNKNRDTDILFEPGAAFLTEGFKVQNAGNLAVKYKISVNPPASDNEKLREVITFSLVDKDGNVVGLGKDNTLEAGKTSDLLYIKAEMASTAGNDYRGLTLANIGITVNATQAAVEFDSFTDKYDESAEYDDAYNGYPAVTVTNDTELNAAIPAENEPAVISLAAGTYKLPESNMQNRNIVFKSNGGAAFDFTTFNVNATQRLMGATVTFDGMNVNFPANSWYQNGYTGLNLAGGKLVFKNCTISGAQYLYVPTAEFINCTFENSANSYSVCTYAAADVTFSGCTFNTAGKAVLMYNDVPVTTNVTLNNCVFNSDKTQAADKAAVETGDDGSKGSNFTITFTGCTANGFVANNSTSNLWGNKVNSNMPTDRLHVTIDGEAAY